MNTLTQDKPLTTIPDEIQPAFDYSGLDSQAVEDLHFAEKIYQSGKKMAERGLIHMGDGIAVAHDVLVANCDKQNNQHSEDTFRTWCLSIGVTKDTAYRLLQVTALLDGSSPRQQKILKELSPSLLYAVAKPSAPAELVQQVKDGDITTHKQYQESLKQLREKDTQLKAEKERADTAESQRDAAIADVNNLAEANSGLMKTLEKTRKDLRGTQESYNLAKKNELAQCDRLKDLEKQLEGSRQVAAAAKQRGDKLKAENEALKKQPIETVMADKDEVARQAKEMADGMTAEYKAKQEQDARDSYDSIILAGRSIANIAQSIKPLFGKLPGEQREAAINQFVRTLGQIQGEVSKCL